MELMERPALHLRTRPLSVLSPASVTAAGSSEVAATDHSPMEVSINVTEQLADDLFAYWADRVSPFHEKMWAEPRDGNLVEEQTSEILRKVGQEYRCIVKVRFEPASAPNATSYFSISRNQSHCGDVHRLEWQADVFEFALSAVVRAHPEVFVRPFQFYLDTSDGTRDDYRSVFSLLGLPLLGSCVGPQNKETIPFPDFHSLIGIFSAEADQNGNPQFPESALPFVERFASIYSGQEPSYDWDNKARKAVYRGACVGTIDPDARDWTVVPLRPQICDKWKLSELIDIGFSPLDMDPDFHFDFQHHLHLTRSCKACETVDGTVMDRPRMASGYRFQLGIDGVGYSYDSTIWKMLSNSTVFFLRPDTQATNLYHAWWYPALKAYHNYIPSTVSELESKVQWCIAEENEVACRQIAKEGRNLVTQGINPESTKRYMFLVLEHLHNSQ